MEILERGNLSDDIRHQVLLSISGVLGMDEWFYPFLSTYLEDPASGILNLLDAPAQRKSGKTDRGAEMAALRKRLAGVWKDSASASGVIREMLGKAAYPSAKAEFLRGTFLAALANEKLARPEIRFLLAAICVYYESLEKE
jgi:hypothetical protein